MHPLLNQPKNPKVAASADKNQLLTFTDYVQVHRGLVYLSMVVDWQFVNLYEAYARATTHVYVPPKVLNNAFRWIMDDESVWLKDGGISFLGVCQSGRFPPLLEEEDRGHDVDEKWQQVPTQVWLNHRHHQAAQGGPV